jgi:peptidoglycan/LPS O-acetylase OafA/YrhL
MTVPLQARVSSLSYMLVVDLIALLLAIVIAHLSYQFFEKPFLKMK